MARTKKDEVKEAPEVKAPEEVDVTVEATEQTEASAEKASAGKAKAKYKLKNPSTSYSETNFTLVGDEEKHLPENPSTELIERIRHGFIVEVDK